MIAFTTLALLPLLASGAPTPATADSALNKRQFIGGWGMASPWWGVPTRSWGWGGSFYKRSEKTSTPDESSDKIDKQHVKVNKRQFVGTFGSPWGWGARSWGYGGWGGAWGGSFYKRSEQQAPETVKRSDADEKVTVSKRQFVGTFGSPWGWGVPVRRVGWGWGGSFYKRSEQASTSDAKDN